MTLYFEFDFVLIFKVLSVYVEPLYSVFTIFKFCIDIMTEMPPAHHLLSSVLRG